MQMKSIHGPLGCCIQFPFPAYAEDCRLLLFQWVFSKTNKYLLCTTPGHCGTLLYTNNKHKLIIINVSLTLCYLCDTLIIYGQWVLEYRHECPECIHYDCYLSYCFESVTIHSQWVLWYRLQCNTICINLWVFYYRNEWWCIGIFLIQ